MSSKTKITRGDANIDIRNIPGSKSNVLIFVNYVQNKFNRNPLKYFLSVLLIFLFSMIIYFIPGDDEYTWVDASGKEFTEPSASSSAKRVQNKASYYASITLFVIVTCLYIFKFITTQYKGAAILGSGIVTVFVILYFMLIKSGIYNNEYTETVVYILLTVIPIILLYRSIKRHITNMEGWTGFILNFILFIPCLIDDFMEYMKGQFARTTNITYALLGIQGLLITAYIALPSLLSSPLKGDAFSIMNEANFLDKRNDFGKKQIDFTIFKDVYGYDDDYTNNNLLVADNYNEYEIGKYRFTLSMWVYLNQQDSTISSSCDLDLFSYGSDSHPSVKFSGVENGKNKLNLKLSGNDVNNSFEVNVESQKWNNIVFNYNGNVADIFINGDLVKSHNIIGNLEIEPGDLLTYGSNEELDGAICNIKYYKKPLSKYQIVNIYNLLKKLNPPINNIM
jgi:hypothetical protein